MRGVWYTTGGGAGVLTAAAAAAAIYGAAWVLAHLILILATGAGCAVLTAVAIRWLMSWSDQHAIRVWAQQPEQLHATATPVMAVPLTARATGHYRRRHAELLQPAPGRASHGDPPGHRRTARGMKRPPGYRAGAPGADT